MNASFTLPEAFNLPSPKALVAFVGGGGKTTLLFALGTALPGRRILTTTTRIFAAQMKLAQASVVYTTQNVQQAEQAIEEALDRHHTCLVVGAVDGEKAVGVPPDLPKMWLARPDVNFVLVEADGSRMRPIKAPAAHEPVIPAAATLVVPVVGIDVLNGRFPQVTHRPELAATLLQRPLSDTAWTIKDVASLMTHPQGGLKGVPPGARVVAFINKVETAGQLRAARQIAQHILQSPRVERVVIGAAQTDKPVREVQQRVTAVMLAAGQGSRMGLTKQLLPWGNSTVLGQTIRHVQQTTVHQHIVVTGYQAEAVNQIAHAAGVETLHNAEYAAGEMLSSLQTAVRSLGPKVTAVLVMLADQPMVTPNCIESLLEAYWQGKSDLIAPVFDGKRGNPVLIGRRYFAELLSLPRGDAPRTLLRRHADKLHLVEQTTDAVLRDLDSLEQYERERKAWEARPENN